MTSTAMSVDPGPLAERARAAGRLAIDTEFMSERRYQALLCLVQAAVPDPEADDGVRVEVFDPLADFDPAPLAAVLADPGVEVVLHAGRQDIAILRRVWDTEVTSVFDTQVAAGFVGHGVQTSYADLVQRLLSRRSAGTQAFTRWDSRPLSEQQVSYARADVAHLNALADALQSELRDAGRLEWAREECRPLEQASDVRDAEEAYRRLPRLGGLSGKARAVAKAVVEWREQTARELNRPPGWLVPDRVVVDLGRNAPTSREDLAKVRGLPEQTLHRRHRGLLEAIERGRAADPLAFEGERAGVHPTDAPLTALALSVVRHRALEAGLGAELVATQADLARIVAGVRRGEESPATRTLEGWRRELVGAELLELLGGERSVAVDGDRRLRVERVRSRDRVDS